MPDKKRKKRKPTTVNVAQLYNTDIGFEGLKKKRLSATNELSFRLPVDKYEESKRRNRMQRFVEHNNKHSLPKNNVLDEPTIGCDSKSKKNGILEKNKKLVGKSMAVEKSYMRLTSAPKANDVRPLPVLRKSLSHVKAHFVQDEDFNFANEQLKSIRQDITVQHLRNNFVLEVYEIHSRILLEHGDLDEFNQCQTMIRSLTSLTDSNGWGVTKSSMKGEIQNTSSKAGKKDLLVQSEETADEFRAYNLLYDVVQNSWCDLIVHIASKKSSIDISNKLLDSRTTKGSNLVPITQGSSVRHAMKVVKAIIHNDYLAFFRLYESAPHMSAYLMDYLVRRVRNVAYVRIIAAYRPTISTERFREALSFHDFQETRQFLKMKDAIFLNDKDNPPFWVDCKASYESYLKSMN